MIAKRELPHTRGTLSRLAAWYEQHPHPRWILVVVILLLYGSSLWMPFFADDFRFLRLMSDYEAGRRDNLGLYRFFSSNQENAANRSAGFAHWWLDDALRFQFMRPLAEWNLYLDYKLWGRHAAGYHATSLALYLVSVLLLLSLYRKVQSSESRSRWAALIFAAAGGNAIPIVWISQRCDLLVLLCLLATLLIGIGFARSGGWVRMVAATLVCLAGLLSKEIAASTAFCFLLVWVISRKRIDPAPRRAYDRRSLILFATLFLVTLVWLWQRTRLNYEIYTDLVIDPFRFPWEYLTVGLPRALTFFMAWPIPANPIFFMQLQGGPIMIIAGTALGLIAVAALGVHLLRRYRSDSAVMGFIIWPMLFFPLLACTMPDARLLLLPQVGLSFLGAVWLRGFHKQRTLRSILMLRLVPAVLLIGTSVPISWFTQRIITVVEYNCRRELVAIQGDIEKESPDATSCAFVLNAPQMIQALWTQDRALHVLGDRSPKVYFLSDLSDVDIQVTGERSLRLLQTDTPILSTLLGKLGLAKNPQFQTGRQFTAPEFTVTIAKTSSSWPSKIDLVFNEPLNSPRYHFFLLENGPKVLRWRPGRDTRLHISRTLILNK